MTTYPSLSPATEAMLLADLEGLWQCLDELLGMLGPDDWSGKHGQHGPLLTCRIIWRTSIWR